MILSLQTVKPPAQQTALQTQLDATLQLLFKNSSHFVRLSTMCCCTGEVKQTYPCTLSHGKRNRSLTVWMLRLQLSSQTRSSSCPSATLLFQSGLLRCHCTVSSAAPSHSSDVQTLLRYRNCWVRNAVALRKAGSKYTTSSSRLCRSAAVASACAWFSGYLAPYVAGTLT
jgi:hypothetical protein